MRLLALLVAFAALAFGFFTVPPQRGTGPALRDFEAYYAAGETWHYRGDPYGRDVWRTEKDVPGVVATRDELLPFVGPPFGLPLWSAFSRLPWPDASRLWALALAVAFATIALGSLTLARGRPGLVDAVAALALAAAFAPLTGGVALGQVAIVSCAAIVALPFALRPRGTLGAAALALVAALQPNLAIVLVARLGETRTWIAFGGATLLAAGASALALGGPAALAHYADVLRAHGAAERFSAIQTTPAAVARALGANPATADALAIALAAACALATLDVAVRRRHAPTMRLALACALLPLAIPFAHEHDFAIAFFPALLVVTRARGVAWVVGAVATIALGGDWIGLAQRPNGIASTVALAVAGAGAVAGLAREPLRPIHALPLAIAPCIVALGALAGTHPLATWPDALPATYRAAAHATAADVWGDEQRRTGVAALDAVWGVLRAIPLLACAVVWAVARRVLVTPRPALGTDAR